MIRTAPLALVLLTVACTRAPGPLTDAERAAVSREVRETSEALVSALNTHQAEEILAFYALDEDFVYVGCTSVMSGGGLFGTILKSYHRDNPQATYPMSVQSVLVPARDVAVVQLRGTGAGLDLFTTRVLQREPDGRWLIGYEHESWPGCASPQAPHPGTAAGDTVPMEPIGGPS
jgi:hypothetical protein